MDMRVSRGDASSGLVRTPSHMLKVGGVTPLTASEYPGKLAAVVFVQGCPWQCGYCHNPHLQMRLEKSPLQWSRVLGLLKKNIRHLDAVVFSGGEPTIDPAFGDAIADVRKLGLNVGLHTGGIYPSQLAEVLPLLDWVALDIKAPFDKYEHVTGAAESGLQALASAEAVIASGVPHEFRTTVHPDLVTESEIIDLARTLSSMGVKNYALQAFRAPGCKMKSLKATALAGFPSDDVVNTISGLFQHFTLRSE